MSTTIKLGEAIAAPFMRAIDKAKAEGLSLSDMYVCVRFDDLSMTILDDLENVIEQATIEEWNALKEDDSIDFESNVIASLRSCLNKESLKQAFESLDLVGPFSVLLIDEEFQQKEELLTIDKDTLLLDNDFFKNLDKELDDFFEQLMSDVK